MFLNTKADLMLKTSQNVKMSCLKNAKNSSSNPKTHDA
jgi:hypothetical protein